MVKKISKQEKAEYISNNLERNLKKYGVSQSTLQKILKYDTKYNKKLAKKVTPQKKLDKKLNSKQSMTRISKAIASNSSYLLQIINFSYKQMDEAEVDYFIKSIN